MRKLLFIGLLAFFSATSFAHEVRPAYLSIIQTSDSTYQVFWKIPAIGDMAPKIYPVFPEHWVEKGYNAQLIPGAAKREWIFSSKESLEGNTIFIKGLSATIIDVLINIELQDGRQYSTIIQADEPFYVIPAKPSSTDVIKTYLALGVKHILFGIDHLLFVLALIIVTSGKWKIIKTVTSFTVAHSITLSLAALGFVSVPVPPVEAVIALSILFLAVEIIKHNPGSPSLTYRQPWLVAFSFGLLHGFGFASALSETGLPQNNIPAALAFFNIGVELGQIVFVLVILMILKAIFESRIKYPRWIRQVPTYAIGSLAAYWCIERMVGFW